MELSDLLKYNNIVIQCHNEPDADAFASGFAVHTWLTDHGKKPRLIYGGQNGCLKPNLQNMKKLLQIPVEYVTVLDPPELLVMVDCRYGERNAQRFDADAIAVIDHHQVRERSSLPQLHEIMESFGSCSTVVYNMFRRDRYDISGNLPLQTALYYGLYMDTSQFQELWHPADRDLWDALHPDEGILSFLKNTNIASSDLIAIGSAFVSHRAEDAHRFGITQVDTQDPNILGIVSDTLLQVDCIDACIVYACIGDLIRFSARSCVKEIRADELVRVIADGIGSAGGHMKKAAGVVFCDALQSASPSSAFADMLADRLQQYFDGTDTLYAGQKPDLAGFGLYRRLPGLAGVADLSTVFPAGTEVMLRTLEGDISLEIRPDRLLMIGMSGEAYPISRAAFEKSYRLTGRKYVFSADYIPSARDYTNGAYVDLSSLAQECTALSSSLIYAKRLNRRTHVFTLWDSQRYIYGKQGDWLAVRKDRPEDIYIIDADVFAQTYMEEKA